MNFKKFLPFENYVLTSRLSPEVIRQRLDENVGVKRSGWSKRIDQDSGKPYEGEMYGNSFTINRVINYKNSFLPEIKGDIIAMPGKTQLVVKMRPVSFVLIFMSIWLGFVGLACVGTVIAAISAMAKKETPFSATILIPFAMFIFGYLLITLSFKAESSRAKNFLKDIVDAEEPV